MVDASPASACEYRHAGGASACRAIHEHDLFVRQPIIGEASEETGKSDAQLKPRQSRAQAIMHAVPQRHVAVRITGDVELVGISELIGVPVGGADHDVENLAFADVYAADFKILARGTDTTLGRRVETEEFLTREVDEFAISFELCELLRELVQPP